MASINLQGDTSGSITISAPSVAGTTTLELPATSSTLATQNSLGVRNLIINGDMRIHQRGGTVNQTTSNPYSLDRWRGYGDVNSTFSMQQSSDAPADFTNSLLVTVLSTQASGWYSLEQIIEGYNITHLNWGTSNAKDITVSFWVKSSVTGTFGGTLRNPSSTFYSYAFEYTINSANTWEQKTVTISGPTVGTWGTGNSSGLHIFFGLSTGSITAGSWQVANSNSSSSSIQFVNNAGATWQITGVQLEVGSTATEFEHLPYDVQLARCQRYFSTSYGTNPVGTNTWDGTFAGRNYDTSSRSENVVNIHYPVQMRALPTLTAYSKAGTIGKLVAGSTSVDASTTEIACSLLGSATIIRAVTGAAVGGTHWYQFHYTANAEL